MNKRLIQLFALSFIVGQTTILLGQISKLGLRGRYLNIEISSKMQDTLWLVNPASYYYLKEDFIFRGYKRVEFTKDTAYINPIYDRQEVTNALNTGNYTLLPVTSKEKINFKIDVKRDKWKLRRKWIVFNYYVYENNKISTKELVFQP